MLSVGSVFAGYRIERVLGAGGMGTVYLARNPDLPRSEALKVLAAELSRDPDFRKRFIREADVAAALDHPNIVSIHQRGQWEGQLWIAMQYVDGVNAEDALRAAPMPAAQAVYVIGEIAKAVDYAHQRGVVHRDIKPANFLLSGQAGADQRVLLGDFGIARALDDAGLTATGSVLATLSYAAPEVLAGQSFDGRADLYSLGCTLFRLLTGEVPFAAGGGAVAVIAAHLHWPPPKITDRLPGLSTAMDGVIATAMAKDPAHRFTSARELAHAAAAALEGCVTAGRTPPRLEPYGISSGTPPDSRWWHQHPSGPPTELASPPVNGQPNFAPAGPKSRRRIPATVAALILAVGGALTAAILTSHQGPPGKSIIDTTLAPPTTVTSPTPSPPPMVKPADLPRLLPPLDDVKNFVGIQNLLAEPPTFQPSQTSGDVDPEECRPILGGGAHNSYDMRDVTGYYSLVINEPRDGPPLQMVGEVVLTFRDPAAAQQQLANSLSIWRRCGGSTMTVFGHAPGSKPVKTAMGVPDIVEDGITTLVATAQGPLLRARLDRAIAAKNNVLIDVNVGLINTDRGQRAVLDVTDYSLGKIPG
ncbi:serine/threonine-protein kinase PknH/PknJ [Mycobacterium sp. 852014-50255_SCH5639931]|uniref:serine/threonine-protein kinase PknH/PknJ n=1 Tax=Mycobacterium sp. 852014-50255_SCH5639931 TaxID=1834112 RepID=UPI000801A5CF|nr:serine/threonine-protein kinase PknH/PknJ [Mycobacterium sp. 852014-50255_SCH5639931]OBB68506.1 serine/threonine protein kinase [Mycobacterium sp. 852014-50255_SCH5639931]